MNEIIIVLLALFGLVAHYLKKLIEEKNATGEIISIKKYYLSNPYTSLSSIVLCVAGIAMLWGSDELTRITAFTLGYMSDSAIGMIMQRQKK